MSRLPDFVSSMKSKVRCTSIHLWYTPEEDFVKGGNIGKTFLTVLLLTTFETTFSSRTVQ